MDSPASTSISDLISLVKDGEVRVSEPVDAQRDADGEYFRVGALGEFDNLPAWIGAPDIAEKPRPALFNWTYKSLSTAAPFSFSFTAPSGELAEIYRVSVGLFLISEKLVQLIQDLDADSIEVAPALVHASDARDLRGWSFVMPRRVLDIVDTRRTEVLLSRKEVLPSSGLFHTDVYFPTGIVFGPNDKGALSFLGKFDAHWWWRKELVDAARQAGVVGLRAVSSYKSLTGGRR